MVNTLYRNEWRLLQNFFMPVMKLQQKRRCGAKVHKRHDRPMTPAQRLLAWKALPADKRQWLQHLQSTLDPVALTEAVQSQLRKIRAALRGAPKRKAA